MAKRSGDTRNSSLARGATEITNGAEGVFEISKVDASSGEYSIRPRKFRNYSESTAVNLNYRIDTLDDGKLDLVALSDELLAQRKQAESQGKRKATVEAIISYLSSANSPSAIDDICEFVGKRRKDVLDCLEELKAQGTIVSGKSGRKTVYSTPVPEAPISPDLPDDEIDDDEFDDDGTYIDD
jgi:hypothetical protein